MRARQTAKLVLKISLSYFPFHKTLKYLNSSLFDTPERSAHTGNYSLLKRSYQVMLVWPIFKSPISFHAGNLKCNWTHFEIIIPKENKLSDIHTDILWRIYFSQKIFQRGCLYIIKQTYTSSLVVWFPMISLLCVVE